MQKKKDVFSMQVCFTGTDDVHVRRARSGCAQTCSELRQDRLGPSNLPEMPPQRNKPASPPFLER